TRAGVRGASRALAALAVRLTLIALLAVALRLRAAALTLALLRSGLEQLRDQIAVVAHVAICRHLLERGIVGGERADQIARARERIAAVVQRLRIAQRREHPSRLRMPPGERIRIGAAARVAEQLRRLGRMTGIEEALRALLAGNPKTRRRGLGRTERTEERSEHDAWSDARTHSQPLRA